MSTRDLTSPSAIAVIAGAGLLCILLRVSSASGLKITRKQLERIVAEKKARLQEAGPSWLDDEGSVQALKAVEAEIALKGTAAGITEAVQKGTLKSEQVLHVMIRRARTLGKEKLNTVTDELYEEAMQAAREADLEAAAAKKTGIAVGVLHGVPISIKDHINIEGTDSTCGLAAFCNEPAECDALVVELLKDAGAIPYCKTNVPQLLMLPESTNHIFGPSLNPWDTKRSPGGSSGGEAGLIAARGSFLGIGTDIGGSIRIPSLCCGIYGFKPTPSRVSAQGMRMPFLGNGNGQQAIHPTAGPMGIAVDDLALVMRAWWVDKMWACDPYVTPKAFDQHTYTTGTGRPLRIGVFTTDHWFEPCEASLRAVREAKAALEKAGHTMVPLEPPKDGWEAAKLFYGIIAAEGNLQSYEKGLQGEPFIPLYRKLYLAANLPNFLRPLVRLILLLLGERRLEALARSVRSGGNSVRSYWATLMGLSEYKEAYLQWMDEHDLDAFLCPGLPLPALPHGMSNYLDSCFTYTFFLNLLHFPAGAVPITTVHPEEAHYYAMKDLPSTQRDSIARCAATVMSGSAGLPVGVQVATRPNCDELCLFVMKELERTVGFPCLPPLAQERCCGGTS